ASIAALTSSRLRTSQAKLATPSRLSESDRREARPSLTPRSASARAVAAPMPLLAPVMKATFPSSETDVEEISGISNPPRDAVGGQESERLDRHRRIVGRQGRELPSADDVQIFALVRMAVGIN